MVMDALRKLLRLDDAAEPMPQYGRATGLRDLLYFDTARAESLYSQIAGGLVREIRASEETTKSDQQKRRYDLKVFAPEFAKARTEATSRLESKVLHHDLLLTLEDYLLDTQVALDLNQYFLGNATTASGIHDILGKSSCLRARGWTVIEDYEWIKEIASRFNAVIEFIGRCSIADLEKSPDFRSLIQQIDAGRASAESEKDPNKRAKSLAKIQAVEERFRIQLQQTTGLGQLDDWLLDGIGLFIDTFMPNRINLRIYPFESVPEFQVICNLKRDCFLDDELQNVVFSYGNRPTIHLTVLGIITSLPPEDPDEGFDPMTEFNTGVRLSDEAEFEKGFRGVFGGMEGFNRFARYSRYPNVTVYPLAVYRELTGHGSAR